MNGLPPELSRLLKATNGSSPDVFEAAWEAFVEKHSRLLLHAVHSRARSYDVAMNQFVFVLEKLREDGCRRLQAYAADGRAAFSTWLVVVAQRLCVDYRRQQYGRPRGEAAAAPERNLELITRRHLADLVAAELDLDGYGDPRQASPDLRVRRSELQGALADVVKALEPRERLLLRLRFERELTAREIAGLMDFPSLFHVYRCLRRVLSDLREELRAKGIRDPRP
ncbi:MAG: sigma-70 family RNA polymerase sigma factor [Gemmatimonadota bacterium]